MANQKLDQLKLVVVSHKQCWRDINSPDEFVTDGGFPLQMEALSELFRETKILVPCSNEKNDTGLSSLTGKRFKVVPLSVLKGDGFARKLRVFGWLISNGRTIWREIRKADAVHTPIPGDIGTIGMIFAIVQRKPLFVRHCGNWLVQRTIAERFWKWSMEFFGGNKNVMLATGGSNEIPSKKNQNIRWIFSSSVRESRLKDLAPRSLSADGNIKLIIVCRQEPRKGTECVVEALPQIIKNFPNASLEVVGDGSLLPNLKETSERLGLQSTVRFHGKVKQDDVASILKGADVFCYPTEASEGFPKVVLEALAAGLPVVTTKISVLPQLIENGCGILLDKPSAQALAEAVEKVCSDKSVYTAMSEKAIETARRYTLDAWRDSIGKILSEAWTVESSSASVKLGRKLRA